LRLEEIRKDFGEGEVLRGITLDVAAGEFLTLLGPSGCGKTTTLRIIAGLEMPTSGRVLLDGGDVTDLPPEKRNVNTVFQNYALFPHMNVAANIGYGLRLRGMPKPEIREKVDEMLRLVQLEGYEKRPPDSLSGGQRQRVAIARAVILAPAILLLDEPLGALDLQLRRQMQTELKALQSKLGITFIYITHDQEEALNMSDRIVVMRDGQFEQVGTPEEIYEHPHTRFAAAFIGQTNLLECTVEGPGVLRLGDATFPGQFDAALSPGDKVAVCVRMERLRYDKAPREGHWCLPATMIEHRYAGGSLHSTVELADGQRMTAFSERRQESEPGDAVCVWWNEKHAAVIR
ncbi:ABC transporter ATP-binding protein, partial [Eubacteriales bacterium OttesenSCG-928-A19]|nr:ABC transporter ATP-binding protein [Eubacteriales bacterium OttesenSCG-928-A19]